MKLSVIIPVYNGGDDFRSCLAALARSSQAPEEIIVVDDASTDASGEQASRAGARVVTMEGRPHGPAAARNQGAEKAQGDVLVFIDADVAVHPDTLARIAGIMEEHPEIAALFGSYDDAPPKKGFVSRYKNLQHHFVHQNGQREASTFWAGCGAIRRKVFLELGGFDLSYERPSIEDIELGQRLKRAGYRIWLCPEVQVAHNKRWNLASLWRSDILDRAVPWSRLILESSNLPVDLNLDMKSRFSAVSAWAFLFFLVLGFWFHVAWSAALACFLNLIVINSQLYRLYMKREGFLFTIGAVVLHFLYYLYSSLTFIILYMEHKLH